MIKVVLDHIKNSTKKYSIFVFFAFFSEKAPPLQVCIKKFFIIYAARRKKYPLSLIFESLAI